MQAEAATRAPQTEHTAPPSTAPEPATTSADQLQNGTTSAQDDADMADATHSAQADKDKDKEEPLPEGATEVVYVHNLNEKIKLPILKQSLKVLFREYGRVLAVTAHANVRMRGQAFVTLDSKRAAANAVREVEKFPLYGKPMVHPPVSLSSLAHARLLTQATVPTSNSHLRGQSRMPSSPSGILKTWTSTKRLASSARVSLEAVLGAYQMNRDQ